jgi:hypothetical protein
LVPLPALKCEAFEPFRCPSDGRCISIQYLCDGAPDCSDSYDEDPRLCTAGNDDDLCARVARWFILRPKIPNSVYFGGP